MNTCEYLIYLFNYCVYSITTKNIVINNYYLKQKSEDKNTFEFISGDFHVEEEKNIKLKIGHFSCNECKKKITGEVYMFNDRSFCNNYCRRKNIENNNSQ